MFPALSQGNSCASKSSRDTYVVKNQIHTENAVNTKRGKPLINSRETFFVSQKTQSSQKESYKNLPDNKGNVGQQGNARQHRKMKNRELINKVQKNLFARSQQMEATFNLPTTHNSNNEGGTKRVHTHKSHINVQDETVVLKPDCKRSEAPKSTATLNVSDTTIVLPERDKNVNSVKFTKTFSIDKQATSVQDDCRDHKNNDETIVLNEIRDETIAFNHYKALDDTVVLDKENSLQLTDKTLLLNPIKPSDDSVVLKKGESLHINDETVLFSCNKASDDTVVFKKGESSHINDETILLSHNKHIMNSTPTMKNTARFSTWGKQINYI